MTEIILIIIFSILVLVGIAVIIYSHIHRHDLLNSVCIGWTEEETDCIPTSSEQYYNMQNEKILNDIAKIQERNENEKRAIIPFANQRNIIKKKELEKWKKKNN